MTAVVTLACLFAVQQLQVEPLPASVGRELVVTVRRGDAPVAAVEVSVQLPTGVRHVVGATDAAGRVRFTPDRRGPHAFLAVVDDVRCLLPFAVSVVPEPWLLALGSVPLGLALLWLNLRRITGRRMAGPELQRPQIAEDQIAEDQIAEDQVADQASTRST